MRRAAAAVLASLGLAGSALSGCAAPYDDDGEAPAPAVVEEGSSSRPRASDVTRVVVDTDLGGDDLAALTFLLRHPAVEVDGVTIAATGLVGCEAGLRVVAGLLAALEESPVPVGCGRPEAGPAGRRFPPSWREVAEAGTGIRPVATATAPRRAAELMATRARRTEELVVVALGPLTNVADLAGADPAAYRRLAGVHAMAGSVDGPLVDGVAEWNAAADPESFAAVLAAPAPLTVVPEDAVPEGTPAALRTPVVDQVAATVDYPRWWDLAAVAALVEPGAGTVHWGSWTLDGSEPGRLRHEGPGPVRVYRSLDMAQLEAAYAETFGAA